ncbi:MAG: hypothetical protein KIT34_05315 [Cyanobacteria bacterium TGS_CYA1]|nr:hypothetical protein [Cyanobacteria bacterium TGS_CYA1]
MRIKSFEDEATLDNDLLKVKTLRLKPMNDKLKHAESRVAQNKKTGITASIQDFMSLATICSPSPSLNVFFLLCSSLIIFFYPIR